MNPGALFAVAPVDGGPGELAMARAIRTAMGSSLAIDKSIHVVDILPHATLAAAVRAGWEWKWPE